LSLSRLKYAKILAIISGILSIFPISFIFQALLKIIDSHRGVPIQSSENIGQLLYMLFIMSIIGVILLWIGYSYSIEPSQNPPVDENTLDNDQSSI
jgi:hypothetical protein